MTIYPKVVQEAAQLWHRRIGRFLTDSEWTVSIDQSYPCVKVSGAPVSMRLGGCKTALMMIDARSAVLINKLNIPLNHGLANPECDFLYGENIQGITNIMKTQINWALDEAREYPLLLVRFENKGAMNCLQLSFTDDLVTVCIPSGSYSFDPKKVRAARNFILEHQLQNEWKKATALRQTISLNEHQEESTFRKNQLIEEHAAMVMKIPLDIWLPAPGTGEYKALSEALATKIAVDVASLPTAHALYLQQQQSSGIK